MQAEAKWEWKVTFETATRAKGHEATQEAAEAKASQVHDELIVKGYNPDSLAYFVNPPHSNPFERLARAEKVAKMVAAIDRQAQSNKLDPHGQAVADWIASIDRHTWVIFAEGLKLRAPSVETIGQVVSVYRARAMHSAELAELATRRVAQ
jgi:hypothetical protein